MSTQFRKSAVVNEVAAPFSVQILQAGQSIAAPPNRTILESALAAGVDYPQGCRSGQCGACRSRLVRGRVEHLSHSEFALSTSDKALGFILPCRAFPRSDASVAWAEQDDGEPDLAVRRVRCRITRVEPLTHDISLICLEPTTGRPIEYRAGQYVRITADGLPARDYSMANAPGGSALEFHIRRIPGGAVSTQLTQALKVGGEVRVEGPHGHAYLRQRHAGPILAIGAGSGLAPVKAIVEASLARPVSSPVHLYFGARTARDLYLVDHFEGLAAAHPNFHYSAVVSDETTPGRWRGPVADVAAARLPDLDGWKVYLAGGPAMIASAAERILQQGARIEDIHADVFFTPDNGGA